MPTRSRPLLGTLVEVSAAFCEPVNLDEAINAAFAAMAEVHLRMSAHEATSDLCALHQAALGTLVKVSPHTVTVLRAALQFAAQSQGAFNPCLGGPLAKMAYLPASRSAFSSDYTALEIVDAQHLRRHAPIRLDLGGIAKGYAVDCAIAALQDAGLARGMVNAGGDLRCFGADAETIGIRKPDAPQQVAQRVPLHNRAMATSAPYFSAKSWRGRAVSALYDPQHNRPRTGVFSVSITAPTCMTADALTKVALNAPPTLTASLLAQHQAEAIWLGAPDAPQ